MGGTIRADVAALHRLAADLIGLAHQLDSDNRDIFGLGDSISDPHLRWALKNVEHDWSGKRRSLTTYLTDVGQVVQQAVDAYGGAEQQIATAATSSGHR